MNRLLTILFTLCALAAFGQTTTNNQTWYKFQYKLSADSLYAGNAFYAPVRDTTWTPTQIGAIVYKSTDQTLYVCIALTGQKWQAIGSGGGGTTYTAGNGLLLASTAFRVDTFNIATRNWVKWRVDSAMATNFYTKAQSDARYSQLGHTHTASQITDFTTAARDLFSAGTGISYNSSTGVISFTGGGAGSYLFSSPLSESGGTVSLTQANGSTNGYLSASDWTRFNDTTSAATGYATKGRLYKALDSMNAAYPSFYTSNGTLSSNRRVTMNGKGLGFYSSSTIYDTLNSTEATFLRGKGKIHAEDGWVLNHVESAGSNHWGRFQAYRATSTDSAILVTLQSRNNIIYNWKNSKFEADWNQWAKMSVNVNWKINNLDTSQKGITVLHGAGLGAGTVKIDREVLPSGSGETVVWDPTTQTLARGSGGGGAAAPTVTTSSATTLTLSTSTTNSKTYVFTGSSATTWTLPALSSASANFLYIKNRGTANITLQRAGSDQLYNTSAVNSITILPGGSFLVQNDGTYWVVFD